MMKKIIYWFEHVIILMVIIMMMATIIISTFELGAIIVGELFKPPKFLLNITNLLEVFGFFFMILIGLELLHTIKTYLTEDDLHVEVVILVAIIAVARKVIILDFGTLNPISLIGMATLILALGGAYYLFKKGNVSSK